MSNSKFLLHFSPSSDATGCRLWRDATDAARATDNGQDNNETLRRPLAQIVGAAPAPAPIASLLCSGLDAAFGRQEVARSVTYSTLCSGTAAPVCIVAVNCALAGRSASAKIASFDRRQSQGLVADPKVVLAAGKYKTPDECDSMRASCVALVLPDARRHSQELAADLRKQPDNSNRCCCFIVISIVAGGANSADCLYDPRLVMPAKASPLLRRPAHCKLRPPQQPAPALN